MSKGEGFALFRWRTINLDMYILPECRHALVNCWPLLSEWKALQASARNSTV